MKRARSLEGEYQPIYSRDLADGMKGLVLGVCINAIKVEFRYREKQNDRSSFSQPKETIRFSRVVSDVVRKKNGPKPTLPKTKKKARTETQWSTAF